MKGNILLVEDGLTKEALLIASGVNSRCVPLTCVITAYM